MADKYEVRLEGAEELIRRLQPEKLLAKPLRKLFSKIGVLGRRHIRSVAPHGRTGRLSRSVTSRLRSKRGLPIAISFQVRAISDPSRNWPEGYAYPKRLEFDPRSTRKGWLKAAVESVRAQLQTFMGEAARDIEDEFRSSR